jgi:tetratricopeptide (TPR) repeat protein
MCAARLLKRSGKGGFMRAKNCLVFFLLGSSFVAQAQQNTGSVASIENLIRSHQFDQALEVLKSGLLNAPKDFRLWTLDGIVLSMKGNDQEAIGAFQRALSLSPNYPAALKGEVQLLYQVQDVRAIPLIERILKADPRNETAHEMIANLERVQGNCLAAIDHFRLTGESIAAHPDSLYAYAYCLVLTKQPQKAISIFEKLSALIPESVNPKFDLAVLLVETKQDAAALEIIGPLLATDEADPELLSLASEAYEAIGDTPKAVSLLRQAIVLNPSNANYFSAFALLCLDHESFQVGIDMLNAGLERIKDDPSLYISRGLLFAQLAEYDKAEADFNMAEHLDSGQSLGAYAADIAELQRTMSDRSPPDNALLEIRTQLKSHANNPLLLLLLAKLLTYQEPNTETNASAEAVRSALLAVKLKPDLAEARDLLAGIYNRSGQYNLAIEQCRLALHFSPNDQIAIYHLIVALRHSERIEQRNQIPSLVKRLSELQEASRQQLADRKRFQLVEGRPDPSK